MALHLPALDLALTLQARFGSINPYAQGMTGPLEGTRVVELGGIGPGPFAGMMLSDLGAEVIRIDRPSRSPALPGLNGRGDVLLRGRRFETADLKRAEDLERVKQLIEDSDVLIDPFRPGATERLGLGPEEMLERNPRLIYGRITGWGQTGPWAGAAGHDLNYIALAGPLSAIGRKGSPPPPPLNLVGDFGGGGMLLALGIAAALVERANSGAGQVVDAAMVDGAALQFAMIMGFRAVGLWSDERESNLLDGGAPFYDTYETADGRWISIAALEPQFYAELLTRLELDLDEWPQYDRARWHRLRERLTALFATKSRDEWTDILGASDACFAPVLTPDEAAAHPQNAARGVYQEIDGVLQPAPAPRFSRTPSAARGLAQ
jgi:alpha-methylacyl-CoA racemase